MKKRLLILILMLLLLYSFTGFFIQYPKNKETVHDQYQQKLSFTSIVESNVKQTKLNYLIFASNDVQYETWKNSYNIIKEYSNLMALEVEITNLEYYSLLKSSEVKPISSKLLRRSIEASFESVEMSQISLNAFEDANLMKVSELWNLGYNGTGVVVAVFDNGINFDHEALVGQNYGNPVLFNEVDGQTYNPCKVHGTPVAGLIASTGAGAYATTLGTAFGSKIVDMQMGCDGANLIGDPIAGFDWLASQNDTIQIVNLSWGAGTGLIFEEIINRLTKLGIVVVVSAGNDNQNVEFTLMDPATAIGSIAVGAVTDALVPIGFSAMGPNSKYIAKPDIVAPGAGLTTLDANGEITYFTGTSGSAPLVSGAIATLISGLEDQNIPWNVGTIKAGLMRSAKALPYDELKVGQGFVNLNATWEYLMNAQRDERGPMVLEITPSKGPYSLYKSFPIDSVGYIPISLIASHPDLVNIEITGNLSQIISQQFQLNNDYSQIVYLQANTTGLSEGWYTGFINASIGNDYVLSEFSISISGKPTQKVLLDLRHTNWDLSNSNNIGGTNIGEMIKLAQSKGIWVHEVNVELTSELLSEYDIVWLPDPFDLPYGEYNSPAPLLASEIAALTEFVKRGGSLLIDFLGTLKDQYGIFGTNSSELNSLTSQFDITTSQIPIDNLVSSTAKLNNVTSFVGGASEVTHFGNYLDIGPKAQKVASDIYGTTIASYQNENGGKVLISSTNFWLDNEGVNALYTDFGGEDDRLLSNNLWDWFRNNNSINIISDVRSQNRLNVNFRVQTKDQNSNPELRVTWSELGLNQEFPISVSNLSETLRFDIEFPNESQYEVLIEYGSEYRRLFVNVDTTLPQIQSLQINQTGFEYGVDQSLLFQIEDTQTTLTLLNINVFLDGVELSDMTYSESSSILNVTISSSLLTQMNHWYTLKIVVTDDYDNTNSIFYIFYVGDRPTENYSDPSATGESSITSNSSSNLSDKDGSVGFIKLSLSVISMALVTTSIIYYFRKKK